MKSGSTPPHENPVTFSEVLDIRLLGASCETSLDSSRVLVLNPRLTGSRSDFSSVWNCKEHWCQDVVRCQAGRKTRVVTEHSLIWREAAPVVVAVAGDLCFGDAVVEVLEVQRSGLLHHLLELVLEHAARSFCASSLPQETSVRQVHDHSHL